MTDDDLSLKTEDPAALREIIAQQAAQIDKLSQLNETLNRQIANLVDYVDRLKRWRFGRRTEKSTLDEMLIPGFAEFLENLKGNDTDQAESETKEVIITKKGTPPEMRHGRKLLSEQYPDMEVVEKVLELPAEELFDDDGHPLVIVGSETKEELVEVPGRMYIRRIIRRRYGRSDTGEKVETTPVEPAIVQKGMLANRTILLLIIRLCIDCLPFNRQSEIYKRQGINISRQVLTNAFHAYAQLVEPLVDTIQQQIQQSEVVYADGSFLYRQDREKRRRCTRTPIYVISDDQQMVMRWRADEKHETASDLLKGFQGYLVRDEWKGWYKLQADIEHVGCLAHARRYFAEKQDSDPECEKMVHLFARIYAVERLAQESGLTGDALANKRLELRQQHTVPIMDQIVAYAQRLADKSTGPKAERARYIVNHQTELRKFLNNGALPPDNNLAERLLRRVAMIRKNRFFYVAEEGGKNLANALTITGCCRLLGINPLCYMEYSLPALLEYRDAKINNTTLPDLSAFTPAAYAKIAPPDARSIQAA